MQAHHKLKRASALHDASSRTPHGRSFARALHRPPMGRGKAIEKGTYGSRLSDQARFATNIDAFDSSRRVHHGICNNWAIDLATVDATPREAVVVPVGPEEQNGASNACGKGRAIVDSSGGGRLSGRPVYALSNEPGSKVRRRLRRRAAAEAVFRLPYIRGGRSPASGRASSEHSWPARRRARARVDGEGRAGATAEGGADLAAARFSIVAPSRAVEMKQRRLRVASAESAVNSTSTQAAMTCAGGGYHRVRRAPPRTYTSRARPLLWGLPRENSMETPDARVRGMADMLVGALEYTLDFAATLGG